MDNLAVIGLDIAKHVFQAHGEDRDGKTLFNRKLRRPEVVEFFRSLPPCLVAIEACGTSYYWGREIAALGHEVRLIPAQLVKAFVPRGKTDANDAVAITETLKRKDIRFVRLKTPEQQATAVLHRTRDLLIRQRTQVAHAARSHLAEFGHIATAGVSRVRKLLDEVLNHRDKAIPETAQLALAELNDELIHLTERIDRLERKLNSAAKADPDIARIMTIPGIGLVTAIAIKAFVPDPGAFKSGRQFAAWMGLTPRAYASGGHARSRGISKMGNVQLRALLFTGATSAIRAARATGRMGTWLRHLLERKPAKVATVALCNKMARIIWALLTKGGHYKPPPLSINPAPQT